MANGNCKLKKATSTLVLAFFVFTLTAAGVISCKKAEEGIPQEEVVLEEGKIPYEGILKVMVGKYLFLPEARGFDIVVQANLASEDLSSLVGRTLKVVGHFISDKPSVLIADTLELKEESGEYRNIYTGAEDVVLDDYIDLQQRDEFEVLKDLAYNKNEGWEGKDLVKVFGKLEEQEDNISVVISDDNGRQVGKIIVDGFADFGQFYIQKLRLFNEFWFYLEVKDTVDWATRRRTRELFHAEILFAGLF